MMPSTTLFDPTALQSATVGRVVVPSDTDYDDIRAGFNGMIDKRPLAILRVANESDVAAGIRFARDLDLPLAIRAGGHSAPGFGSCDDGLVIDCRDLQDVSIDDSAQTIACGSGLTWLQFDAATQAHGLAVTGGRVSGTGVAGLTIGSGSGWLERAMGLTSDSLIGVRMVTAEGAVVDSDDDADLIWALRGGGGNFGVITELRFQLHRLGPSVTGGQRFYPLDRGREVLSAYRDVMMAAPKELCGGLAFITAPPAPFVPEEFRGKVVAATIVLWAGDPADAADGIAALDALGEPIVDLVMTELSDEAVDAIVGLAETVTEPLTQIICAPLGAHTQYAAVDDAHSAIGHRGEQWSFQVLSLWSNPADDAQQKAWTKDAAEIMSSYSDMVSYPNFLSADEAADTETAYSPGVYRRLRAVKDRYDPTNVFRINNNIPPTSGAAG
jgi:FAD/FMN-containing dehydrogenase